MTDRNNDLDLELRVINLQLEQLKIEQAKLKRKLKRVQSELDQRNQRQAEDIIQGAYRKSESCSHNQHSTSTVAAKNKTKPIVETELAYNKNNLPARGDKV